MAMFKHGTPPDPVEITVSIRDNLDGADLVTIIRDTSVDPIESTTKWVLFDFEDISVTPGSTYYIVVSANAGASSGVYCWTYASVNDTYTQGDAWWKASESKDWVKQNLNFNPRDFCFKTYYKKPITSSVLSYNENLVNPRFLSILERFPHAFPILRQLFGY